MKECSVLRSIFLVVCSVSRIKIYCEGLGCLLPLCAGFSPLSYAVTLSGHPEMVKIRLEQRGLILVQFWVQNAVDQKPTQMGAIVLHR